MNYRDFSGNSWRASATPANWASGRAPVGVLTQGTQSGDQLIDDVGGSFLEGLGGDDTYLVVDSSTRITEKVGGGTDTVVSWNSYRLSSNIEVLQLSANLITGIAADTGSLITTTASRTNLVSGRGNDVLADEGKDLQNIFVFDAASGNDVVYGFSATGANHDFIRLTNSNFSSFDAVRAAMTQVGADVKISFSANDAVLIRDTNLADLTNDDFLLPFSPDNLKLTFADEFNSVSLYNGQTGEGTWKTSYTYGPSDGWGSFSSRNFPSEMEIYVDPTYAGDPAKSTKALGLNPFSTKDGVLSITASKLTSDLSDKLFGMKYASGVLTTEKTFAQTYGYFEIRGEVPITKGMFPAFWLLPSSRTWPPEIDIMENVGQNFTSAGAISDDGSNDGRNAFYTYFPDGLTGMHTYGLLWNAETITWYVDGQAVGSIPTPADMHQPMYMIVNLAVGHEWAGGEPNSDFTKASFNVDYVHAYSLEEVANTPTSSTTIKLKPTDTDVTLLGTAAIDATGNTLANVLTGNAGSNKLTGGAGDDTLLGMGGNDILAGGDGNDVLDGGAGNDAMSGGKGDDTFIVDNKADTISEMPNQGADTIRTSVDYTLSSNVENGVMLEGAQVLTGNGLVNVLTAHDGGARLFGAAGDDTLIGGKGNDTLDGGAGLDKMVGGAGGDVYYLNNGLDNVVEGLNGGHDLVYSTVSYYLQDNVEDIIFTGSANANSNGNNLDNRMIGNAGANRLWGFEGNDWIEGGAGNDVITGGMGADKIFGGAGNDILDGEWSDNDELTGGAGADTFKFGWGTGRDSILDFGANNDRDQIDISTWLKAGFKPVTTQVGDDVVITLDKTNVIVVEHTDLSHLVRTDAGYNYTF